MIDSMTVYKFWLASHLHFTTEKYDVIKYRSRVSNFEQKYKKLTIPEVGKLKAIGRLFNSEKDVCNGMVACYLDGFNPRYASISEIKASYEKFIRRKESMGYTLENDDEAFHEYSATMDYNKPTNLLNALNNGVVSPEYVVLQDSIDNFLDMIYNDYMYIAYKPMILTLRKYRKLFNVSKYVSRITA